jgi:hypothetical protein
MQEHTGHARGLLDAISEARRILANADSMTDDPPVVTATSGIFCRRTAITVRGLNESQTAQFQAAEGRIRFHAGALHFGDVEPLGLPLVRRLSLRLLERRFLRPWERAVAVLEAQAVGLAGDVAAGPNGAKPATAAEDDDAYVIASKLWRSKFSRYEDCKTFLATSSIRTKGKGQRRLIHAADWANHWAAVDKTAFEALENYDGEPIIPVIVDAEQLAETARERYRKTAARVRKK